MQDDKNEGYRGLYTNVIKASHSHNCHLGFSLRGGFATLPLSFCTLWQRSANAATIYFTQITWTSMRGKLSMEGFMRRDTMHCLYDLPMVSKLDIPSVSYLLHLYIPNNIYRIWDCLTLQFYYPWLHTRYNQPVLVRRFLAVAIRLTSSVGEWSRLKN